MKVPHASRFLNSAFYSELSRFFGRDSGLTSVKRWSMTRYSPMFYRTDDLIHSTRLVAMMEDGGQAILSAYPNFDLEKALALCAVHDDGEIIAGDAPTYHVERRLKDQVDGKKTAERLAVEQLAGRWPKQIGGYVYSDLVTEALDKKTLEAQLMSFMDKMDGFCEAIHEIYAGNNLFVRAAVAYAKRLSFYSSECPLVYKIGEQDHPFLRLPIILYEEDFVEIVSKGKLHTTSSLREGTLFPQYTRWLELTLANFGDEPLVTLKEK
jgi:hypothetical protein